MMDQAEEVQEALGRTYNTPEIDDDELAAELDALGDEIALDDDASYLDDVLKAPEAPSNKPEAEGKKNPVTNILQDLLLYTKLFDYDFRKVYKWTNLAFHKFPSNL